MSISIFLSILCLGCYGDSFQNIVRLEVSIFGNEALFVQDKGEICVKEWRRNKYNSKAKHCNIYYRSYWIHFTAKPQKPIHSDKYFSFLKSVFTLLGWIDPLAGTLNLPLWDLKHFSYFGGLI